MSTYLNYSVISTTFMILNTGEAFTHWTRLPVNSKNINADLAKVPAVKMWRRMTFTFQLSVCF